MNSITEWQLDEPVERVYRALSEPRLIARWIDGAELLEDTDDGLPSVGSRFRLVVREFGMRTHLAGEFTAVEPNQRVVMRLSEKRFEQSIEYTLAPTPAGCRVRVELRMELVRPSRLLELLADKMTGTLLGRQRKRVRAVARDLRGEVRAGLGVSRRLTRG